MATISAKLTYRNRETKQFASDSKASDLVILNKNLKNIQKEVNDVLTELVLQEKQSAVDSVEVSDKEEGSDSESDEEPDKKKIKC